MIVSNRLPVSFEKKEGEFVASSGSGGLVSALSPLLKKHGGSWVGWLGLSEEADFKELLGRVETDLGYELHPVSLTEDDINNYYFGFSNEILWPLFHGFETRCNFKRNYYQSYKSVNRKFAEVISKTSTDEDFVWIQDYQLMEIAKELKALGVKRPVGFFLHIPFPPLEIFLKLPWREEILAGLLEFDIIGVHTPQDAKNLMETIDYLSPSKRIKVGVFPISIDYEAFNALASSENVAKRSWFFHEEYPKQKIILGTDRLDYIKGIPERIEGYRLSLEKYPEMQGKVILLQVLVPSRMAVPEYESLKTKIERMIGEVNGQFGVPGWTPIHYFYRNLPFEELIAYYRAAEIALVTSLRDGMNLVAKEYIACNVELNGVLILSEFAGAAGELKEGALIVNPYDSEAVAEAIYKGFKMSDEEKKSRMSLLRSQVQHKNIDYWLKEFLLAAGHDLHHTRT
jgi:trehalose 6-phosphate synthase